MGRVAATDGGAAVRRTVGPSPVAGSVEPDAPRPVVFHHGYLDGHLTPWWDRLTDWLAAAGWPTDRFYTADTPGLPGVTTGDPRRYADGLQATLETVHDRHGQRATVVGHSMGGLVGRWAIEEGDGSPHVSNLVTLGTPHQGTYTAYLAFLTAGGRALAPGSEFLRTLNETPLHPGVGYTSLYSAADPLVRPARAGRIPDAVAHEDTENVRAGHRSHTQLVADPDVLERYLHRLE